MGPLLESLESLEDNPLDINRASAAELQQLPGVSPQGAFQIIRARKSRSLRRPKDLSSIGENAEDLVEAIDPYVSFPERSPGALLEWGCRIRTRVLRTSSVSTAKELERYFGSPEKVYTRIVGRVRMQAQAGNRGSDASDLDGSTASLGLLMAKDPGESRLTDCTKGHLAITVPSLSAKLILGDFAVESGQGLVFWKSSAFSKGSEPTAGIARNGVGIRPTISAGEAFGFRGLALGIGTESGSLDVFYSARSIDATQDSAGIVTYLKTDGLHRTESEMQKISRQRETALGGRISVSAGFGITLGISGFRSRFREPMALGDSFGFRGNEAAVIGFDALYTDAEISAFGECAKDQRSAIAGVGGLLVDVNKHLTLAFLGRTYPRDFNNVHSSGFSESGDGSRNESGAYVGFMLRPTRWLRIKAFVDQFSFPWRNASALLPAQGNEYYASAEIRVRDDVRIDLRFRQKTRGQPNDLAAMWRSGDGDAAVSRRTSYRGTLTYEPTRSVVWQNRVELVSARSRGNPGTERGMLVYQDLALWPERDFSLSLRAVAFYTDSYEARVYEYEQDLPGAFASSPLSGTGMRWYLVGRLRFRGVVLATFKVAQTHRQKSRENPEANETNLGVQCDITL